jgi:hypothetical protein
VSETVLVVGSYPPVPVPGSIAAVAEVRRAWAEGNEVVVAAPRLGAAHLTVPVAGALAGRRLANVGRVTGARRLVLVVEDGYPFSQPALPLQAMTAAALIWAFRSFDQVRLVRVSGGGPSPVLWKRLAAAADETDDVEGGPPAPGVTPLGPPEQTPGERAKSLINRLLGGRGPAIRARLRRLI